VPDADTSYRKGLLLTAIGGFVLTFDIPLILLAEGEPWSILMLRTGTTFAAGLVMWAVWRFFSKDAPALIPGWAGLWSAMLYGAGSVTFITAVYNTSTANLVFILAFVTMFAALLSWLFLGERPAAATLIAMVVMILGVAIIVGDSIGSGSLFGDALALCTALLIAGAITISRASGKDMGFTALIGVIFPFIVATAAVGQNGFSVEAPWWIIFNGAVVTPIAVYCLATGPKYVSGPEVAMFYLLETVLAPVWVWMIFSDAPSRNSLIGGTILVAALVAHSLWHLRESRRRRSEVILEHPA
jgi:drug/metabolite transporter (DMT)-like permease